MSNSRSALRRMKLALFASAVAAPGLLIGAGGAHAQTAAAAAGASSGEIIVTAEKRAQRLQDVPAAVTAITGADLTQRSILTTEDLAALSELGI